jgi:hypothetical protein
VDVPSPPPYPSDLYDYRSAPFDPAHPLSAFQEALARLRLRVPTILAEPVYDPERTTIGAMTVLSMLSGENVGDLTWRGAMAVERSNTLLLAAVSQLHALTEPLNRESAAGLLPRMTLGEELEQVVAKAGQWLGTRGSRKRRGGCGRSSPISRRRSHSPTATTTPATSCPTAST